MFNDDFVAILKQIKDRKLDGFFELESKLISRAALERGILDILLDPEMGSPNDKLRFFLIYYLMLQQPMPQVRIHDYTMYVYWGHKIIVFEVLHIIS